MVSSHACGIAAAPRLGVGACQLLDLLRVVRRCSLATLNAHPPTRTRPPGRVFRMPPERAALHCRLRPTLAV
jgi:hypothetical protein